MNSRGHRRPAIVWVPVGINVALVALAALLNDVTAVALTAVGAVAATGAIVVNLREADRDKERIAHLQMAIPNLTVALDADAAVNLAPKPSPVMSEVLRQNRPVVSQGAATPISIPPAVHIDRS